MTNFIWIATLRRWVHGKFAKSDIATEAEKLRLAENEYKDFMNKTLTSRRSKKNKQKTKVNYWIWKIIIQFK